jgi:uncharacterized protein (DUF2384 family)
VTAHFNALYKCTSSSQCVSKTQQKVLALKAGILQKIKRTACSRGPFLYSKQNHGQDSTTAGIRRLAEQVFGNKDKADTWLNQPKTAFGGVTPLELAFTESGYELVKAELEKLSHGFTC